MAVATPSDLLGVRRTFGQCQHLGVSGRRVSVLLDDDRSPQQKIDVRSELSCSPLRAERGASSMATDAGAISLNVWRSVPGSRSARCGLVFDPLEERTKWRLSAGEALNKKGSWKLRPDGTGLLISPRLPKDGLGIGRVGRIQAEPKTPDLWRGRGSGGAARGCPGKRESQEGKGRSIGFVGPDLARPLH